MKMPSIMDDDDDRDIVGVFQQVSIILQVSNQVSLKGRKMEVQKMT